MNENQEYINNAFNIPDESQNHVELTDSEYLEKYSDIGDEEYFNLFGSRKRKGKAKAGGNSWNKNEAKRFSKKIAGSVETARTKLDSIISVSPEQVKKSNKAEKFAKMQAESKVNKTELEAQWTAFQNAQKGGWDNSSNRETARKAYNKIIQIKTIAIRDWKLRHNYITDRKIDKVSQAFKTTNPVLIGVRAMFLLFLRVNALNSATYFKLASIRTPDKYNSGVRLAFKRLGGNRTKWDNSVNKGYKKKPLMAKKMTIDWGNINFDGFNVDGEKRTLKIPSGVIASTPAAGGSIGGILGYAGVVVPPASVATAAAGTGAGTTIGGILTGLFGLINGMNIPLGAKESQPEADNTPPTPEEIANAKAELEQSLKDAKEGEYWIPKVPNWLTVTISTIFVLGTIGGILYSNGVFDKKSK